VEKWSIEGKGEVFSLNLANSKSTEQVFIWRCRGVALAHLIRFVEFQLSFLKEKYGISRRALSKGETSMARVPFRERKD